MAKLCAILAVALLLPPVAAAHLRSGARGSPTILGTISAVAGLGVLRWGPPVARLPAALWLSLLGVAVGLSKGQVFLHLACRSYVRSGRVP